jgi:RNA polymerase-binding protein DksA
MHQAEMATYRQRLIECRDQLVARIYTLAETREGVTEPQIEFGDKAQAEAPAEVLARLDEQSREEWEAIQVALARIEAGTYGSCEACGKTMTAARLEAMPMASRCLPCQQKRETERKGTSWT